MILYIFWCVYWRLVCLLWIDIYPFIFNSKSMISFFFFFLNRIVSFCCSWVIRVFPIFRTLDPYQICDLQIFSSILWDCLLTLSIVSLEKEWSMDPCYNIGKPWTLYSKWKEPAIFLVVQWLRLCASNEAGKGWIPKELGSHMLYSHNK